MNASPNMDSVTAHFLRAALKRPSLHLLIYHPQWLGGWRHQAR
jgi:hypothetical protein